MPIGRRSLLASAIGPAPGKLVSLGSELRFMFDIGANGYTGFELCHLLPVIGGRTAGIDFVDNNARLAAESIPGILGGARKQRSVRAGSSIRLA